MNLRRRGSAVKDVDAYMRRVSWWLNFTERFEPIYYDLEPISLPDCGYFPAERDDAASVLADGYIRVDPSVLGKHDGEVEKDDMFAAALNELAEKRKAYDDKARAARIAREVENQWWDACAGRLRKLVASMLPLPGPVVATVHKGEGVELNVMRSAADGGRFAVNTFFTDKETFKAEYESVKYVVAEYLKQTEKGAS